MDGHGSACTFGDAFYGGVAYGTTWAPLTRQEQAQWLLARDVRAEDVATFAVDDGGDGYGDAWVEQPVGTAASAASASRAEVAAAPEGWERILDESTGSSYYVHYESGVAQWAPPGGAWPVGQQQQQQYINSESSAHLPIARGSPSSSLAMSSEAGLMLSSTGPLGATESEQRALSDDVRQRRAASPPASAKAPRGKRAMAPAQLRAQLALEACAAHGGGGSDDDGGDA